MDFGDSDEELFPIEPSYVSRAVTFVYTDPLLVTGILRAVVEEDLEKIKKLVKENHSLNINDNNGNTPLHVAVIKNNLEILNYLVSHEDIRINTRNFMGHTPLYLSVKCGHLEAAKILVEYGANVNLPDNEDITPLHRSVQYPELALLLINNGANVNSVDYSDDSPLHDAVAEKCLETVCMLLYHGADANALGGNDLTPFMKALISENVDIQEALFDYVDDYTVTSLDECSTLTLALTHDNPYVEEIINRGAVVDAAAFRACVNIPNSDNFSLIWSRLTTEDADDEDVSLMLLFLQLDEEYFYEYINIIIENSNSDVLNILAEKTLSRDYAALIGNCAQNGFLSYDQITKLTCLLLQHGFKPHTDVIVEVFLNMKYCELFKILLYIDYVEDWTPFILTPRLIFDITSDIKTRCDELIKEGYAWTNVRRFREDVVHSFDYWVNHSLLYIALNQFTDSSMFEHEDDVFKKHMSLVRKIPSLLQLARDQTRKYIVNKFKFKNTSQYYTYINHMDLSMVYKKILMFEKKIYT